MSPPPPYTHTHTHERPHEREAVVICPRDGRGGVPLLPTVLLASLVRGARVDEDVLLLSSDEDVRSAVPSVRVRGEG